MNFRYSLFLLCVLLCSSDEPLAALGYSADETKAVAMSSAEFSQDLSDDYPARDFERRYSETFPISRDGRVRLENRYGEINVTTWSQPQVKIDVLVTANVADEDDFERILDRISIRLSKSGNTVSGITDIDSGGGNSWWEMIFGGGSSNDFKIYYTVSLPRTVELEVDARYCDVELPDLDGRANLDVAYGDLVGGRLTASTELDVSYGSARLQSVGDNSSVRMRYSEGSIRRAQNLRYDGRYSEISLDEVGDLTLDVGYEEVEVGTARELRLDGNYNELSVDRVARIYLDGNYTDFNIGTVTEVLEVETNYGDIEVDELGRDFQRVDIRAGYADVEIDMHEDGGYELDLEARYGDIDAPTSGLNNRHQASEGSTESLRGSKGSGGTIRIRTSYGDIELY